MPIEQGCRLHDERRPDRARQASTCRRQEDAVCGRKSRTTGLAAQERQLVPQHDNLQLLELAGTKSKVGQLQYTLKRDVTDVQHDASPQDESAGHSIQIEFAHPTRSTARPL